jgi:Carboxypeptidase regulatory-like domain
VFVVLIVHKANVFIPNLLYHHSAFHTKISLFFWHIACVKQLFAYNRQIIHREVVMAGEETRHDLWIKRINTWIGILGGSVASIAGAYNFLPSIFPPAQGAIAAVVREHGGAPVGRAHVELLSSQNVLLGTSETDRDGRYIKKDLEPGSYTLKVRRGGFEPQVTTVNVASKKTTDLELVLRFRSRAQAPTNPPATSTSQTHGNAIRSALEETGAAWIKNLGKP